MGPSVPVVISGTSSVVRIGVITGGPLGNTPVTTDAVGASVFLGESEGRKDGGFNSVVLNSSGVVVAGTASVVLSSVLCGGRALGDNAVGRDGGAVLVSLDGSHAGGVGCVDITVANSGRVVISSVSSVVLKGVTGGVP